MCESAKCYAVIECQFYRITIYPGRGVGPYALLLWLRRYSRRKYNYQRDVNQLLQISNWTKKCPFVAPSRQNQSSEAFRYATRKCVWEDLPFESDK